MTWVDIENKESGSSVRAKLNSLGQGVSRAILAPYGENAPQIPAQDARAGTLAVWSDDGTTLRTDKTLTQFEVDMAATAQSAAIEAASDKANKTTTITAGTGLTGGGDLTADRTIAVSFGALSGTVAEGNDSRITGAVQTSSLAAAAGAGMVGLQPGDASTAVLTVAAWAARIVYLDDFLHTDETLYDNAFDRAVTFIQGLGGGTIKGTPGSVYSFNAGHVVASGARVDSDFYGCTLNIVSTNLVTFDLQAAFSEFRGARIVNGATQVAGSNYIKLSATATKAINNDIYGDYLGIYSLGTLSQVLFNRFYASANGATRIWVAGGDTSQLIFGNVGNYIVGSTPAYGIKLTHATATEVSHNSLIAQGIDCAIVPGNGEVCASVKLIHNFFDTADGGLLVKTVAGAIVSRLRVTDVWASSHTTSGIVLDSSAGGAIEDTTLHMPETSINADYGISLLGAGTTGTVINLGTASQNTTAAFHAGVGVGDFKLIGWQAGATATLSDNGKAVILDGSNTNYSFWNCKLGSASGTGVTGHTQTQTERIADCENFVTYNYGEPTLTTDAYGQAFWDHGLAGTPIFASVQGPLSYDSTIAKVIAVTSTQVEILLFDSTTGAPLATTTKTYFIEAKL